jgi:hypothetical protein
VGPTFWVPTWVPHFRVPLATTPSTPPWPDKWAGVARAVQSAVGGLHRGWEAALRRQLPGHLAYSLAVAEKSLAARSDHLS